MEKTIEANGMSFRFVEDTTGGWTVFESYILPVRWPVDLQVRLAQQKDAVDWNQVQSFLNYILENQSSLAQCIEHGKAVLKALLIKVWQVGFKLEDLENFDFDVMAIIYSGCRVGPFMEYNYELSFGPRDVTGKYQDLGTRIGLQHLPTTI